MKYMPIIFAAGLLSFSSLSFAQPKDIPSCYDALNLQAYKQQEAARQLIVIVDQTSRFDASLKESVHQQVEQFIQQGDQVQLIAFSANAQGKYTEVVFNGQFDHPLSAADRNSVGKMTLNKLDACLKAQQKVKAKLHKMLSGAFGDDKQQYPKTELIGSLLQISSEVVSPANGNRKVILVVSDMLENSSITSFYAKNTVRQIDASAEIAKVSNAGIIGNFGGADVHVIGAGFVGNGMAYSSQQALASLETFWRNLIKQNNGTLQQFGKPKLLSQIQ